MLVFISSENSGDSIFDFFFFPRLFIFYNRFLLHSGSRGLLDSITAVVECSSVRRRPLNLFFSFVKLIYDIFFLLLRSLSVPRCTMPSQVKWECS